MKRWVSTSSRGWVVGLAAVGCLASWLVRDSMAVPVPEIPPRHDEKVDPRKDAPENDSKRNPPRNEAVPGVFPEIDDLLPPGFDPAGRDRLRKELERVREQLRKQMEEMRNVLPDGRLAPGLPFGGRSGPVARSRENRLGVRLDRPSATLVDQLDLPRGQGLVVRDVEDGSAAAKAGLKPHDVLLEIDGKKVPDDLRDFARSIEEIKADATVDVTVLRKGRKETIKGVAVPEAKEPEGRLENPLNRVPNLPGFPRMGGIVPGLPLVPGVGAKAVSTSVSRTGDQFTIRHVEDGVEYRIAGKVTNDVAGVSEATIVEGNQSKSYGAIDEVPEAHREKVKSLAKMAAGRQVELPIK